MEIADQRALGRPGGDVAAEAHHGGIWVWGLEERIQKEIRHLAKCEPGGNVVCELLQVLVRGASVCEPAGSQIALGIGFGEVAREKEIPGRNAPGIRRGRHDESAGLKPGARRLTPLF